MKTFVKVLSSPWTHVALGLIFWIVPPLLLYCSGQVLDRASFAVGGFGVVGILWFDFGLSKFQLSRESA